MESCILKVLLSADLLPGVIARVESLRSAAGVCQLWRDLAAAHVKAERRPKILLLECGCSGVVHIFDVVQRAWSVQRTPLSSNLRVHHGSAALVAASRIVGRLAAIRSSTSWYSAFDPGRVMSPA